MLIVAGGRAPAIARDGTLSFLRPDDMPIELVRMSRSGVIEAVTELADTRASMLTSGPLGTGYQQWGGVSVSPDASRVAVSVGFSPGRVLVYDVARGSQSVVASGTFPSRVVWTKDGSRLIYASSRDARAWNLWSRRADGAGEEQRLSTSEEVQLPGALSPDGATLVYSHGSGPNGNFFKMPLLPAAAASPLFTSRTWGLGAGFSPDGRLIAIDAIDSGRSEVFVRPFPEGDQRIQVSNGGGTSPVWTQAGEILYATPSAITAVSVTTRGGSLAVSKPVVLVQTGGESRLAPVFGVTPDGKTLFMLRLRGREQLSLIFNWGAELTRAGTSSTPTAR